MLLTVIFLLPILFVNSICGAPVQPTPVRPFPVPPTPGITRRKRTPFVSELFPQPMRDILLYGFMDALVLVDGVLDGRKDIVDTIYGRYFHADDAQMVRGE